jgi:hypothetical protein
MSVLLATVVFLSLPVRAAEPSDPVQEAADWKAVVTAAVRNGGAQDEHSCFACAYFSSFFSACMHIDISDLKHTQHVGECTDSCRAETTADYPKIADRMKSAPLCAKEMDSADDQKLKELSEDSGTDLTTGKLSCKRCQPPDEAAKWPSHRQLLMGVFRSFDEALGKTDAPTRNASIASAVAEAKKIFTCAGDKIDSDSCVFTPP